MIPELVDKYFIKQPRLRRLVTALLFRDREDWVHLLGARILVHRRSENGYWRASRLASGSSLLTDELPVLIALAALVGPNRIFVDVGANVGIYSVALARFTRIHSTFRVVAFEVAPATFARLAINAERHGFIAHQVALGDSEGRALFVGGAVSHVTTRAEHAGEYNISSESFDAEVRRLDAFELRGDLVIKIDVEGQELSVLRGATRYFDAHLVAAVYLDGYTAPACWDFLEERGFDLYDGRTLQPADRKTYGLLALRRR